MIACICHRIYNQIYKLWDSRDTRLNHMPFMSNPLPMVILIFGYLFMIRNGKVWMEHRQPTKIESIIIAYNVLQILWNSMLIFVTICYISLVNKEFSIVCEPSKFGTDPMSMFEAYLSYSYFLLKLSHFFDTVFFILRKKWSQITILHVYHHVMVSISAYVGILSVPGGHSIIFGFLNCFENAIMYTYYFLSTCKPMGVEPIVTMKKNVVRIQIVSFYAMAIHFGHVLVIPGHDCGYNRYACIMGVIQSVVMIALYAGLSRRVYGQKKEPRKIE